MLTAARFASRLVGNHGDLIVKRSFSTLLKNVSKKLIARICYLWKCLPDKIVVEIHAFIAYSNLY